MPTVFWLSLILILSIYVGYPFFLFLIGLARKGAKVLPTYYPTISIIIPSYNEEKIIERKIKNTLNLEYPKEKLEIIIASDGSTDRTKAIVERYLNSNIIFFDFPRRGKLATLNQVIPQAKGEILVLSDASAMFVEDALQKLIRHFTDGTVGVVTGVEKIIAGENIISASEIKYWNYETKIKELEGKIYSTVGANGPIYAIRKELFPAIPSHLNLCDDMTISLNAVKKGKRIILEPEAIAFEEASLTLKEEWRRKVRIATQAWQSLFYDRALLIPFKSLIAFPLIFHKLLRWLTFSLMAVLLISNFFVGGLLYNILLIFQIAFHTLSILGLILLWHNIKIPSIMSFSGYFLFTNLAQAVGLYNAIFNKGKPIWQPIQRV